MRHNLLPLLPLAAFLLAGCQPADPAALSEDNFRLSVEEIATGPDLRVLVLTITNARPAHLTLQQDFNIDSCDLSRTEPGQPYAGKVVLSVARVVPLKSPSAHMQTQMLIQTGKSKVGPRVAVNTVPADTPLDTFAPFVATAGVYKRDEPVSIIKDGKQALKLIVGKSVQ
jgi:hypothetical protein